MKAIFTEKADEKHYWAFIVSDEAPAELPTDGENVDGMTKDQLFAPLSMLYVTGKAENKVYVANEQGTFIPQ